MNQRQNGYVKVAQCNIQGITMGKEDYIMLKEN